MHTFISVGFTTAQWQSMTYITTDPEGWVQNVANVRAGKACKEITEHKTKTKQKKSHPQTTPILHTRTPNRYYCILFSTVTSHAK